MSNLFWQFVAGLPEGILFAAYIWLPGFLANMIALVGKKFPLGPLDGGRLHRDGNRILGETKTWGGLLIGTFGGWGLSVLCYRLIGDVGGFRDVAGELGRLEQHVLILSLAFGALAGDAVKSYAKRRRNFPSGYDWRPWDKIDQLLGTFVVGGLMYLLLLSLSVAPGSVTKVNPVAILLMWVLVLPLIQLVCQIGNRAGLKDTAH